MISHAINIHSLCVSQNHSGMRLDLFLSNQIDQLSRTYLKNIIEEDGSKILFIKLNKKISPYIASKGSITIEGVSLTVNDVKNDYFNVNIIPVSYTHLTLPTKA